MGLSDASNSKGESEVENADTGALTVGNEGMGDAKSLVGRLIDGSVGAQLVDDRRLDSTSENAGESPANSVVFELKLKW